MAFLRQAPDVAALEDVERPLRRAVLGVDDKPSRVALPFLRSGGRLNQERVFTTDDGHRYEVAASDAFPAVGLGVADPAPALGQVEVHEQHVALANVRGMLNSRVPSQRHDLSRSRATRYALFVVELILGRRSVREGFDRRDVPQVVLEEIVACGLSAPSSKNAQPWRIHVVRDRPVLGELADAVQSGKDAERYVPIDPATGQPRPDWPSTVAESATVLRSVAVGLFVENRGKFSDGRRTVAAADDSVRESALIGYGFEMIGLGACVASMWLAARSHGLSGIYMGDVVIAEEVVRARLGMRGDLAGVLALGYSDGSPTPKALADDRVVWH